MVDMYIKPGGTANYQVPYVAGRFAENEDAYLINQVGGVSAFGDVVCSLGSDYALEVSPDGTGRSWLGSTHITPPGGHGKACYIKDKETGEVWSAFYGPVCEKCDEYEVKYLPGQASVCSLKSKIASTLTLSSVPNCACEIWKVRLENRSARNRTLSVTTYVEPFIASVLEVTLRQHENTLLMRRPLSDINVSRSGSSSPDLVLFHSSTLAPARYQTSKATFIGDARSLRNPAHIDDDELSGGDGVVTGAIASFTVEVDLPIEGEAEFGFSFGAAANAERALMLASSLSKMQTLDDAVNKARMQWNELSSTVRVKTSDRTFNALVNTWLPYETYAGWTKDRTRPSYLDPSRVADLLRRLYPLSATAHSACHNSLLSFAAGLSIVGSYTPDEQSLVTLPAAELLWLATCAARYVAETGDASVLSQSVPLRDGPVLTLKEHCERAIRACLNCSSSKLSEFHEILLERTLRLWLRVCPDMKEAQEYLVDNEDRRLLERKDRSEEHNLPRRVRYLQSICPTLTENSLSNDLDVYLGQPDEPAGNVISDCCLYSLLTEHVLGISATAEGLSLDPHLPISWLECRIERRFREDTYNITITRSIGEAKIKTAIVVDGEPVLGTLLPYFGDGEMHNVEVVVG